MTPRLRLFPALVALGLAVLGASPIAAQQGRITGG